MYAKFHEDGTNNNKKAFSESVTVPLGCVQTRSYNACVRACASDKLSFRKMNGNRRKCSHRTRATKACARCFQATRF